MTPTIRLARSDDAARIAELYAPYVADRPTSFELVPPDAVAMAGRIEKVLQQWPWLVWADERGVQAYAYASAYAERAGYRWSAYTSVYVADDLQRGGVGRALYTRLLDMLLAQGIHNAMAGITLPNEASVGLHRSLGFEPVGVARDIGFKLGAWHDVLTMQLVLRAPVSGQAPEPPRSLPELLAEGRWPELAGGR